MVRAIWIVNFKHYNPPPKDMSGKERRGAPLKWVRLQCDWVDDEAVFGLPDECRWIWPALLALAGKGRPRGKVSMDAAQLAVRLRTSLERIEQSLTLLTVAGRIKVSGEKVTTATTKVATAIGKVA